MNPPTDSRRPPCLGCRHYFITHDVNFPYGCRAFDFKSRRPPILEVVDASGSKCLHFEPKPAGR